MNYDKIKKKCEESSNLSRVVIDEFLLDYTGQQKQIQKALRINSKKYRNTLLELPPKAVGMLNAQLISHSLFKKGGMIGKIQHHSALKFLTQQEKEFIQHQIEFPWKFSFGYIKDNPANDFYLMLDAFSGEEYLLYSPGMTRTLQEKEVIMWLNLIAFNGECWQSYGVIIGLSGFEPDDIYFFACQLNNNIESDEDMMEEVESNPFPFMLLLAGSNSPLVFHKDHQVIHCISEIPKEKFIPAHYQQSFKVEYNQGVFKLTPEKWGDFPHFGSVYYDENLRLLVFYAMTRKGFTGTVECLNNQGKEQFDAQPDLTVNQSMITTAEEILNLDLKINDYDHLFEQKTDPEKSKEMEKINQGLMAVIEEINSGKDPDMEKFIDETGLDKTTAEKLINDILRRTRGL